MASPDIQQDRVLLLGSAPTAAQVSEHLTGRPVIVAINNSWRAVSEFDYLVYPPDFHSDRRPASLRETPQKQVSKKVYVKSYEKYGGVIYCGATMAFTAGYWAIDRFPKAQIAFFASDMNYSYSGASTHFYGTGIADPLRNHLTLQNLEALSCRLFYHAMKQGTLIVNGTIEPTSRLVLPRVSLGAFSQRWLVPDAMALYASRFQSKVNKLANVAEALEANSPFDYKTLDYKQYRHNQTVWDYIREVNDEWAELRPLINEYSAALSEISQRQDA